MYVRATTQSYVVGLKSRAGREFYQGQIEATDRQIDALVYELYGLTEKEIGVVEGNRGGA